MADKRELALEGLPRPGEPLTPDIHQDNKALLDEELQKRMARLKAKLSKKEHRDLLKQKQRLAKKLKAAGWNDLVTQRWEIFQDYDQQKVKLAFAEDDDEKWAVVAEGRRVREQGKVITARIANLQPIADEFEAVCQRLNAHEDALKTEREDEENRKAFRREALIWEAQIKSVFRQSARLHHAWDDEKGKRQVDIPQIERIIFKEDRVLYHIRTSAQSIVERLISRWHSALPYNVDVSDLYCDETLENLSAACNRVVTVERSKRGTNFFYSISRLDAPDGLPEKVLYSKVLDWYPVKDHAKTPWFAGVAENRKVECYNFEDFPHIMIAGATKGGKSNHINQMIATFVTMNTPAEVRLILVDLKGGIEFTHWTGIKHALRPIIKKPSEVLPALALLRTIMERRLATFETVKAKNLFAYNAKQPPGRKLARLIFVIDEMATLMELDELKTAIDKQLMVISSQGRAVGIHLVICTQRTSVDVVPPWMKTNAGMMISAKMPNQHASMTILDSVAAANLPNIRGRMVFSQGRMEVICQSPLITDEEIARAVTVSQTFPDPDEWEFQLEGDQLPVFEVEQGFGRDDAIEVALTHLDGKLSAQQIYKIVGHSVTSEYKLQKLVRAIVDDGIENGIVFRGKRYYIRKERRSYIMEEVETVIRDLTRDENEGNPSQNGASDYPIELEKEETT